MGSTFVNIQVHARGHETTARLEGVEACLRSVLREDGFLPTEAGEANDRTVLVATGPNWIGVYDQLCDEQRQDVAQHLASALSRQLQTHAITILIHDSSVLWLELFETGALIDSFNSDPEYFGKVSAEQRKSARGRPDYWSRVLAPGEFPAALRTLWRKRELFPEDTLREMSPLLGLDVNQALVGFRYLQDSEFDVGDIDLVRLGFRRAVRTAHETRTEGPPRLEFNSSSAKNYAAVGFSRQFGDCSVRNLGGASRGLSVILSGDALDRELLSITSIQLVVYLGEQRAWLSSPTEGERRGEQRICFASFPDLEIAAGPADANHSPSAMGLHANLFGEGLSPGTGVVQAQFVPHGAPQGQAVISLDAEVFVPARLPLRAASDQPGPRLPKHVLVARVSMDLEQAEAAAVVGPIVERFCEFLGPSGELSLAVFPRDPRARPRTSKAKLSGLKHGARWQKLKTEFERAALVNGVRKVSTINAFARQLSDGFSFGESMTGHEVTGDPELPTFALWFDLENVQRDRSSTAESLFEAVIAEIMVHHSGVQALVARTTGIYSTSLDLSEYEAVCGIHGMCTLRRSWLSRFVRDVQVGTLWLGGSLTNQIPDMAALETAARVEPFGGMLKVTIANEEALASVEHALAPLLPSQQDARLATDRLFGR